jgi:flavin reductase (DIM6/NTAB) family NADH-FMN oxidoreductase RutF
LLSKANCTYPVALRSSHLVIHFLTADDLPLAELFGTQSGDTVDKFAGRPVDSGPAHKVSVSMPADLTAAVQQRVGRGKFSQYVTEAVSRRLELDMLAELSDLLAAEHGPVPEEYLAEARAAWPDNE